MVYSSCVEINPDTMYKFEANRSVSGSMFQASYRRCLLLKHLRFDLNHAFRPLKNTVPTSFLKIITFGYGAYGAPCQRGRKQLGTSVHNGRVSTAPLINRKWHRSPLLSFFFLSSASSFVEKETPFTPVTRSSTGKSN